MTFARSTREQEKRNGLVAGSLALAVTLLGDEKVSPFQALLAFGGGYIVGSRAIVLKVDDPVETPVT